MHHHWQRAPAAMRCQPAGPGRLQSAPRVCTAQRVTFSAPAGRPPRHWRLAAAADEAPDPQQSGEEPSASHPAALGSWAHSAYEAVARAFFTLHSKIALPSQRPPAPGPALSYSRETLEVLALLAQQRAESERIGKKAQEITELLKKSTAEMERRLDERKRRAAQQQKPSPAPLQPPARAPAQRPGPLVWGPAAAEAAPAEALARLRAAEASAAAAAAWAATAVAREAASEAAAERASSMPAALHTAGAEEWEWAAAAWHAAHEALAAARQACPDAPAVREAEGAVEAAAALRAAQRGWRGGDDGASQA